MRRSTKQEDRQKGIVDQDRLGRHLAQGLGRVVSFLQANDTVAYRDAILHACTHNTALDPQLEGSRAAYMLDVMQATGEPSFYRERILVALAGVTEHWDAVQLFQLVRLFAVAGDPNARSALYAKFFRDDTAQRFTGAEELVALDGLAGFMAAARQIGTSMRADPEVWEDDDFLSLARDRCGRAVVDQALGEAAARDQDIATYVRAIRDTDAQRGRYRSTHRDTARLSYAEIAAWIARRCRNCGVGYLHQWGRATDEHPCCWLPTRSPSKPTQIA